MKDLIKKILRESQGDFDWVNDILDNGPNTMRFYIDNDLLVKDQIYNVYGEFYDMNEHQYYRFPEVKMKFVTKIAEGFGSNIERYRFTILDGFNVKGNDDSVSYDYDPGDYYSVIPQEYEKTYLTPLEDSINESNDFDWINDIPEAKWDDDWTPEDLIGKKFKWYGVIWAIKEFDFDPERYFILSRGGNKRSITYDELRKHISDGTIEFI